MQVTYNYEFEKKLRAGFIGCGDHSYRNILPVFQYAPIDLTCVCDFDAARAQQFGRLFGAQHTYLDFREMLKTEDLDVVFIVTGYNESGQATYPQLAAACLENGVHVWIEKPPVNSLADVELLRRAIRASGRKLAIGFKKMFFPANARMKSIIETQEFGQVRSISLRYPQYIPTVDELNAQGPGRRVWFLDHLCHPVSILQYLGGRIDALCYTRAENGAGFAMFNMRSGATAVIHFSYGQAKTSILERTEVTGDGGNVIVENNTRLTYYRRVSDAALRKYGRASDFTGNIDDAPLVWEPEFSLGNLYNKGLFLLGYYNEILYFCDAVLNDREIEIGNIEDADEGIRVYEAFKRGPNTWMKM